MTFAFDSFVRFHSQNVLFGEEWVGEGWMRVSMLFTQKGRECARSSQAGANAGKKEGRGQRLACRGCKSSEDRIGATFYCHFESM